MAPDGLVGMEEGGNETTQMCWGLYLPDHEPEVGGAQELEIGGLSPTSSLPSPCSVSLAFLESSF